MELCQFLDLCLCSLNNQRYPFVADHLFDNWLIEGDVSDSIVRNFVLNVGFLDVLDLTPVSGIGLFFRKFLLDDFWLTLWLQFSKVKQQFDFDECGGYRVHDWREATIVLRNSQTDDSRDKVICYRNWWSELKEKDLKLRIKKIIQLAKWHVIWSPLVSWHVIWWSCTSVTYDMIPYPHHDMWCDSSRPSWYVIWSYCQSLTCQMTGCGDLDMWCHSIWLSWHVIWRRLLSLGCSSDHHIQCGFFLGLFSMSPFPLNGPRSRNFYYFPMLDVILHRNSTPQSSICAELSNIFTFARCDVCPQLRRISQEDRHDCFETISGFPFGLGRQFQKLKRTCHFLLIEKSKPPCRTRPREPMKKDDPIEGNCEDYSIAFLCDGDVFNGTEPSLRFAVLEITGRPVDPIRGGHCRFLWSGRWVMPICSKSAADHPKNQCRDRNECWARVKIDLEPRIKHEKVLSSRQTPIFHRICILQQTSILQWKLPSAINGHFSLITAVFPRKCLRPEKLQSSIECAFFKKIHFLQYECILPN
jgi:hypothetical protein